MKNLRTALSVLLCLLCWHSKADAPIIEHTIVDDGWVEVPLDFTFPYWGNTYTTSFMFANGVVGFISPNDIVGTGIVNDGLCCQGYDLENTAYADMNYGGSYGGVRFDFTIMPLHTDLIDTGAGHFYTQGDSTYQKYMWESVDEYYDTSRDNTFDLTIYPIGTIKFHYEELNIANHSVTVAIVGDLSEGEYIQWFYNHPTQNGALYWDGVGTAPITVTEGSSICQTAPLSSTTCNGYAEAYAEQVYAENCAISALYDYGCAGYENAYIDNQCEIDPLYSVACAGYAQALAESEVVEVEEEEDEYEEYTLDNEVYVVVDLPPDVFEEFESYVEAWVDLDFSDLTLEPEFDEYASVVDEVETEIEMLLIAELESMEEPLEELEPEPVEEEPVEEEPEPVAEEPTEEEPEPVAEEPTEEEPAEEEILVAAVEEKEPAEDVAKRKEKSKREKMKQIITNKLKSLAVEMGQAASLEEQKNLQNYILALLSLNTFYDGNTGLLDGSFYDSKDIYSDMKIPENQRGLRNGLAQQILHNKLVDLQWRK